MYTKLNRNMIGFMLQLCSTDFERCLKSFPQNQFIKESIKEQMNFETTVCKTMKKRLYIIFPVLKIENATATLSVNACIGKKKKKKII